MTPRSSHESAIVSRWQRDKRHHHPNLQLFLFSPFYSVQAMCSDRVLSCKSGCVDLSPNPEWYKRETSSHSRCQRQLLFTLHVRIYTLQTSSRQGLGIPSKRSLISSVLLSKPSCISNRTRAGKPSIQTGCGFGYDLGFPYLFRANSMV